ncbi:single-stranded DNA-binding protein [Lapillicoccus sp.]|uniref:single-stranded DNA-binding protein n=1 Tax=Lapillicoccus sp. TaxID=1909287 RepID=UPI0039836215
MNESFVTVMGNLVGDPQGRSTKAGKPFASFRVASTTRRWDAETRGFVDGSTNFMNVVGFNALGGNIMGSLRKGDPVVVYGRLRVNQWVNGDGVNMTSVEVDAYSVGHDLARGQSSFSKPERIQYDANDRLADPNIQASLDAREPDDSQGDGLPDEEASSGGGDEDGNGLVVHGGFSRTTADADTDDYVVANAG